MKKKIIFMIINMNIGGTEKALLNMISKIPKEEYEITIFMLENDGGFLHNIPENVRVENFQEYNKIKNILNHPPHMTVLKFLREGKLLKAIIIMFLYLISKVTRERSIFIKYILKDFQIIETKYDVAVAYAGPMDFISYFVLNKIKAKKKIQWIHFDITKIGFNRRFASKIYKKFDKIFIVSKEGKEKLINLLPNLEEKTDTFFNLVSPSSIIRMANDGVGFKDNFSGVRILTVGRLAHEKGQDLTISVLANLKKDGYNVRWYCIGDGEARKDYEKLVEVNGLRNDFIFLGGKSNPYPFMKDCDIYVQPSRHEGYCITLSEAKCFKKPIICTNFTGAREQIIHNHTGLIVNFDEHQMYKAIKKLLDDEKFKIKLEKNSLKFEIDTSAEIDKLFNLVSTI
ncbi:glycosyltransferase [Neobacillus ginsengisoli]|uniref:Glycosyltransferase involved in cell wall biosynthesis n=1 Tax=Neobacillus ginsengisoli TaxID=904295 RepID=A0ABT9XTF1_9BACI|nr:glycosyltransferase [Neobacillus ginsengisoli]MDQ0198776.1 glycosyltransferase involved in cell wall biosynthesis [Neobacillus ginsengisoli]